MKDRKHLTSTYRPGSTTAAAGLPFDEGSDPRPIGGKAPSYQNLQAKASRSSRPPASPENDAKPSQLIANVAICLEVVRHGCFGCAALETSSSEDPGG